MSPFAFNGGSGNEGKGKEHVYMFIQQPVSGLVSAVFGHNKLSIIFYTL